MSDENNNNFSDEHEKVCSMCHRTESRAGKMLRMPGGMYVCMDCLQRTVDTFESTGFDMNKINMGNMPIPPMFGMPFMNGQPGPQPAEGQVEKLPQGTVEDKPSAPGEPGPAEGDAPKGPADQQPKKGIPAFSFINLSDPQGGL